MVAYPQAARTAMPFPRRWSDRGGSGMSPMKMGMACAAVCVAMLSMTMIAMRKRDSGKTRKSR
jgi:hypothetical protein